MVRYTLFGNPIAFDDGAERFFDLQHQNWTARDRALEEFSKWYQKCADIGVVLAQYRKFGGDLVEKFALKPLFSTLADSGIFDVSRESYRHTCLDMTDIDEALRGIQDQYKQIERTQAAQEEYRQARKDSRSRWQGGGFGLSGVRTGPQYGQRGGKRGICGGCGIFQAGAVQEPGNCRYAFPGN